MGGHLGSALLGGGCQNISLPPWCAYLGKSKAIMQVERHVPGNLEQIFQSVVKKKLYWREFESNIQGKKTKDQQIIGFNSIFCSLQICDFELALFGWNSKLTGVNVFYWNRG